MHNLFAEMGGKAEFKYNRQAAIQKAAVVLAVVGLGLLLWSQSKGRAEDRCHRHSGRRLHGCQ